MSRIILGSSNMQRFYSVDKYKQFKPYLMLKTCTLEIFKARMVTLDSKVEFVIVQVIENILADAAKQNLNQDGTILDNVLINTAKAAIQVVIDEVKKASILLPKTKFAMIMPLTRPALPWYNERFEEISKIYDDYVAGTGMDNIKSIECFAVESQKFEADNIHLTDESGSIFIGAALATCEIYFTDKQVGLPAVAAADGPEVDIDMEILAPISTKTDKERISYLENRLRMTEEKAMGDNLALARDREDLDAISNEKKENKLIITGLTCNTPIPEDAQARKIWYDNLVSETLNKLDPEGQGKILYIKPGRGDGRQIPMVEVSMETKEMAKRIRAGYVNLKRTNANIGKLFVANCVSLATRVRADILRAISKKLNNPGKEEFYVAPFSSRPVLHVKDMSGTRPPYALVFADAVARYGDGLTEDELGEAYRRAGSHFDRQLRQIFVVLKEDPNKTRIIPPAARGVYRGRSGHLPYRARGSRPYRGAQQRGYSRGGYSTEAARGERDQADTPNRGTKRPSEDTGATQTGARGGHSTYYGANNNNKKSNSNWK